MRIQCVLLVASMATTTNGQTSYSIPVRGVAFRNGCTTNCPLLIGLHGASGTGSYMAQESNLHRLFTGITAYPDGQVSGGNWPIVHNPSDSGAAACFRSIQTLMSMPDVDQTRISIFGYSNGGFYTYALACPLGDRLLSAVVVAGLKVGQPSCPHRTNMLHVHNANDGYNTPVDPLPGEKPPVGGVERVQLGLPTSLRANWLDASTYPDGTTNGASGVTTGLFTLYSASQGGLRYDYWSYN